MVWECIFFFLFGYVGLRFYLYTQLYCLLDIKRRALVRYKQIYGRRNVFDWYFMKYLFRVAKKDSVNARICYFINIANHLHLVALVVVMLIPAPDNVISGVVIEMLILIVIEFIYLFIMTAVTDPVAYKANRAIHKKRNKVTGGKNRG